jgi:hypothetical protein
VSARGDPGRRGRRPVSLEFLASVLVGLLAIQFLLGTYLEIFVTIPPGRDIGAIPIIGLVVLVLHIVVGILLVGLSLRMTLIALRTKARGGTILAGVSALGILVAFLGGMGFTFGDQSDVLSFVMATGFFLAMLCSGVLLAGSNVARRASGPEGA